MGYSRRSSDEFARMHLDNAGKALVFKTFDTDRVRLQGCPHSAFDHPGCPEDVVPRASVEIRAYAYYGEWLMTSRENCNNAVRVLGKESVRLFDPVTDIRGTT